MSVREDTSTLDPRNAYKRLKKKFILIYCEETLTWSYLSKQTANTMEVIFSDGASLKVNQNFLVNKQQVQQIQTRSQHKLPEALLGLLTA